MTRSRSASSRRGRRLAGLLAAALVVFGCADDAPPTEPSTTPAPSTTSQPDTAPSSTAPPTTAPPTTATPSSSATTAPPPELTTGLVWTGDFPDPYVLTTDTGYHAYATSSGFVEVQRIGTGDGRRWTGPQEALGERADWAVVLSIWAPAVLRIDNDYVLYYTARIDDTDLRCISVARAAHPTGPFVDSTESPWLCPTDLGGAIDPSPFVDRDGSLHLLWKSDGVTLRRESSIWSQPLSPDGRTLVGPAVRLIDTDQDWEFPHVEAPSMLRVDDTYWLAYSGNWWNQAAYGVGFAHCDSPVGPCTKPFDGPVLHSTVGAEGPGGGELFVDGAGRPMLAYHAWLDEAGYPGARALRIEPVDLTGAVPVVG